MGFPTIRYQPTIEARKIQKKKMVNKIHDKYIRKGKKYKNGVAERSDRMHVQPLDMLIYRDEM